MILDSEDIRKDVNTNIVASLGTCPCCGRSAIDYKALGERYSWSVEGIVDDLAAIGLWPVKKSGSPIGYKKLYHEERLKNIRGYGHVINRVASRFAEIKNDRNARRREKSKNQ